MGIPFRERRVDSPVVFYPQNFDPRLNRYLRELWPDRKCYAVYWSYSEEKYHTALCDDAEAKKFAIREEKIASYQKAPWRNAQGEPWWLHGGWRAAFPWVPGLAPSR